MTPDGMPVRGGAGEMTVPLGVVLAGRSGGAGRMRSDPDRMS